ncbi:poly-gamma-glutamate hydrolase family protein [Streptomyces sp. NPDC012888]|uniref:poly-gamma-glutamate hydrolase family protein n=1 Tax=Streptomyces sp. NPDC012888 TaxID=3364855 RepID=UPI0036B44CB9
MTFTSRRTLLTSMAAAAATLPLLNDVAGSGAVTAVAAEVPEQASNTVLYSNPKYREGEHWMRRFRTHPRPPLSDNLRHGSAPVRSTAIIAPHGGGIEAGTSELCLAIAGYKPFREDEVGTTVDPVDMEAMKVPGVPQRDYWMFEGLALSNELHVTSTNCDDPAALAVCGENMYAVSLHGFLPDGPGENPDEKKILIGGRDQRLMRNLRAAFKRHGLTTGHTDPALNVTVVLAGVDSPLNGDDVDNIVNRTRTGAGAQLEISTKLRHAMFEDISGAADRRATAGKGPGHQAHFWNAFVNAVREAVDRHERGIADA